MTEKGEARGIRIKRYGGTYSSSNKQNIKRAIKQDILESTFSRNHLKDENDLAETGTLDCLFVNPTDTFFYRSLIRFQAQCVLESVYTTQFTQHKQTHALQSCAELNQIEFVIKSVQLEGLYN